MTGRHRNGWYLAAATVALVATGAFAGYGAQAVSPTNEAQYLEWKWRRNLADPATGLDYSTVSRQLPALMAEWSRSNTWTEVKVKMFGWLCDNVALDVSGWDDVLKHPEKYKNLQVRVCGWNVRWNDIPKREQDKFILRQESIR